MRIEDMVGKAASRQASLGGFETEDVLYLLPLVTLSNALVPFLIGGRALRAAVRRLGGDRLSPGAAARRAVRD